MRKSRLRARWFSALAIAHAITVLCCTGTAGADLISAKYRHGGDGDPAFSGAALLGAAGDQWNDINDDGFAGQAHTYTPIIDSTGATVSGVTVDLVNNYWGGCYWGHDAYWAGGQYNVSSSDPYYDLLRSYFGDYWPETRINGLTPYAAYDLVVYLHTHDNRRCSVIANGTEIWGSYSLPGAPIVIGRDALVFKNVIADVAGMIYFRKQNGDQCLYSGFQLRTHFTAPPPTAADNAFTIAVNAYRVLASADFNFASTDPLGSLAKIKITQLPAAGSLTLSSVPVLVNQIIQVADLNAGNLRFTPATDGTGTPYDIFQFKVSDGDNFSALAYTMTVNVMPQASLLNVKFYRSSNGDVGYAGPAAVGTGVPGVSGDVWNNIDIPDNSLNPTFALTNSAGGETGVGLRWNSSGWEYDSWGSSDYWTPWGDYGHYYVDSSSPYYNLLRSYIRNMNMTVYGLTPGTYDFFVYLQMRDGVNQSPRIWVNGRSGVSQYDISQQSDCRINGSSAPLAVRRDYVKFKALTVDANGQLNFWYDSGEELLCGFQLMPASSNTVPTAADNAFTIAVNSYKVFAAADFGFSDTDPGDELQSVKVTVLPTAGTLTLSGSPVLLNQVVAVADINAGSLRFTPATDQIGSPNPYDTFQFKVFDGTDYSAAANTISINVMPQAGLINVKFYRSSQGNPTYSGAAAIGAGGDEWNNIDIPDNTGYVANRPVYELTNAAGSDTGVKLKFNQDGWEYNSWGSDEFWTPWGDYGHYYVDSGSPYYNLLRSYIRNMNMSVKGLTPGSYDFFVYLQMRDGINQSPRIWVNARSGDSQYNISQQSDCRINGSSAPLAVRRDYVKFSNLTVDANGELNFWYDSGEELLCGFQLVPATGNSAPTAADNAFTIAMNSYKTFAAADFGFADVDPGDELQKIKVTALPSAGQLTLGGSAVLVNQQITVADINAGNLRFTPASYVTGASYASFDFKVSDGTLYSTLARTMTINVEPRASLINVKFYRSSQGNPTYSGAAAIGAGGDLWNNIDIPDNTSYVANRPVYSLTNAASAITGVQLKFNQDGWEYNTWGSDDYTTPSGYVVTGAEPQYNLLRSYIRNMNMSVKGLTPGVYDFYVYLNMRNNVNQSPRIWINGGSGNVSQQSTHNLGGAPLVAARDYVLFKDAIVGATGELNFWYDNGQELLCGFQLAQGSVPLTGSSTTVTVIASADHVFTSSEFSFASVDFGNSLAKIKVTALPASGTLSTNGVAVVLNDEIPVPSLAGGVLTFVSASTGADSFQFQVSDGVTYSPTDTMNINVLAAPPAVLISAKYRHGGDGDPTYSGAALLGSGGDQWNDINDSGFAGQAHTYTPITDSTGAEVSGVTVALVNNYWGGCYWGHDAYNAGGQFNVNSGSTAYYDLLRSYFGDYWPETRINGLAPNAGYDLVVYLHTHDNRRCSVIANGTEIWGSYSLPGAPIVIGRDALVFKNVIADGTGMIYFRKQNGDQSLYCGFQLRPHVSAPLPTAADNAFTIAMNSFKAFAAADFNFASTDPLSSLVNIKITQLPTVGSLTLNGNTVLLNQVIVTSDIGSLKFQPAAGGTGSPYDTFKFKVSDGASYSASAYTMTVNVLPQASLIDIQFYKTGRGDTAFGPGAAAIGSPGDIWNNCNQPDWTGSNPTFPLVDASGNPSAVTAIINGWYSGDDWGNSDYWTWGQTGNPATHVDGSSPYYNLLRSYLRNPDIYLNGLTPGNYDVFVYLNARVQQQMYIAVNGVGKYALFYQNGSGVQNGTPLVPDRDYVEYKNVTVGSDCVLHVWRAGGGEYLLCGLQIRPAAANNAPTGADSTNSIAKNTYHTFNVAEFGFADSDVGDVLQNIRITALPSVGALSLSGGAVLVNQVVTADQLRRGYLQFTPAADGTGSPYDSFQFKVSDGVSYSVAANTVTFNVLPQASLIDIQFYKTGRGDTAYGPGAAAIGSPADIWNNCDQPDWDGYNPTFQLVDASGNPSAVTAIINGWYSGDDWGNSDYWTWGQTGNPATYVDGGSPYYNLLRSYLRNPDIYLNGLTPGSYDVFVYLNARVQQQMQIGINGATNYALFYQNGSGVQNGTPLVADRDYVEFKNVTVSADGVLHVWRAGGGEYLLCGLQIRPAAVNTAPTGADFTNSIAKNTYHTFNVAEFGFADSDVGDVLQNIKITAIPTAGVLYLTGWEGPVLLNQIITADQLRSGYLYFMPAAGGTGSPYDSFQFKVSDGISYSLAANTVTFNVLPQASLIDVQFYKTSRGDTAYGPGAAAIGSPGDIWNNCDQPDWDGYNPTFQLLDTSGNASAVTATINGWFSGNDWGSGDWNSWGGSTVTSSSPYYNLLRSYLRNPDIYLNGLTPGIYDLYVYINSQVQQQMRITANNVTVLSGSAAGDPLVQTRDYLFCPGVTVGTDGSLHIYRDGGGEYLLCGLQLKAIPTWTWIGGSGNDWATAANWYPVADPNSAGGKVIFGTADALSGTPQIPAAGRRTGLVAFTNSLSTTISGPGTLTVENGTPATISVSGNHVINAPVVIKDNVTVAFSGSTPSLTVGAISEGSAGKTLTISGNGTMTINGVLGYTGGSTVGSGSTLILDRAAPQALSGAVSGAGRLQLAGGSTFTATVDLGTSGGIAISNATTLQLGNGGTSGSVSAPVTNNGTLTFNRSDSATLSQVVSGSGRLVKSGAGTLTVTRTQVYGGDTVVSSGTLRMIGGHGMTVTSGLQAWFDATNCAGDTWTDSSGNGHTATRINGTVNKLDNQVNGLPAVQFDGNGISSISGSMYSKTQFIVTKMNGGDWGAWMGSAPRSCYMWNQNGNCWDANVPAFVSKNGTPLSYAFYLGDDRTSKFMVLKIVGNDNNSSLRTWELGRAENNWCSLNNYMAELLTWDRVLSAAEEDTVGGWLASKYDITTTYSPATAALLPVTTTVRISTGGVLELGAENTVAALYIDNVGQPSGTWGATGSGATHIDDVHFAGTGILTVNNDNSPSGLPIVVSNDAGATPHYGYATLRGGLLSLGGAAVTVKTYWGDNDGGTTIGNWDHVIVNGSLGVGSFAGDTVEPLTYGVQYYYRTYAEHAGGSDPTWSAATKSFVSAPETVENIAGGNWSVGASWLSGSAPASGGSADYAILYNTNLYSGESVNNLDDNFLLNQLNFGSSQAAVTLSGNSLAFTNAGVATPQLNHASANAVVIKNDLVLAANTTIGGSAGKVTIQGAISGRGWLTKVGAGTVTLSTPSTYAGGTIVSNGTLELGGVTYADGLRGSMFQSTPDNADPMDLTGASYEVSLTRVFTGTKAGTVLAMTQATEPHEIASKNIILHGAANSWSEFGGSPGDNFVTVLSGTFFPTTTGSYNFRWDQDDIGWLWIDLNNNGVFDSGESVGNREWHGSGNATLSAGQGYNFMFFMQEFGGGDNLQWWYTPPGGSEAIVNPTAQPGQWRYVTESGGSSDNVLPATTSVRLTSGSILKIGNASNTVDSLYLDGVQQAAGTWGSTTSTATHKNDTYFSGNGVLDVSHGPGSGTTFLIR